MNARRWWPFFFGLCAAVLVLTACGGAAEGGLVTEEESAKETRDIRIGCFNTGEYAYWYDELDAFAKELQRAGVLSGYDEEKERKDTPEIWADICACSSGNLRFLADEYYESLYMSEEELEQAYRNDDVDLMIALGTTAATFLSDHADILPYDYFAIGIADPVSAGLAKSADERVNDKSFVVVDATKFYRQIDAMYEFFHFRTVGVVYEDRPDTRAYSGIRQLEERAKEYGFEILRRHVKEIREEGEEERYYSELKEAYDELSPQCDLIYITTATIEDEKLPWLLEDVMANRCITVAQTDASQVEHGALMHIKVQDAVEEGQFAAQSLISYGNRVAITDLDQHLDVAPSIYLNADTIEKTGVKVPMTAYLVADRIFSEIETGDSRRQRHTDLSVQGDGGNE